MTLERRTRLVARARPATDRIDQVILFAGLALAGLGFALNITGLVAAGAAAIGWSFRPDAERYYLEGFSDGLVAADALGAERTATAGQRRGDHPDVPGLPGGAGEDDADGADRRADPDQPGAPDAGPADGDVTGRGLRGAFGLPREPRPGAAPFDRDGSPIVVAQGPRGSGFPEIPAAEPARPPGGIGEVGPATRRQARGSVRTGIGQP